MQRLPSNPLDLYFMPYTHSLVATAFWAALVFVGVKRTGLLGGSTRVALATAGAVASHFLLDFLVHRTDLPLLDDASPKLGLALWNHPALALVVEIGVLAAAAALYVPRAGASRRRIGALVAGLALLQIATVVGPLPPTIPAIAVSLLLAYFGLAWLAASVDRRATA